MTKPPIEALALILVTGCGGAEATNFLSHSPESDGLEITVADEAVPLIPYEYQASAEPQVFRDAELRPIGRILLVYFAHAPIDCDRPLAELIDDGVSFADFRVPLDRAAFDGTYDEWSSAITAGPFLGAERWSSELAAVPGGYRGQLAFARGGQAYRVEIRAPSCAGISAAPR